MAAKYLLRCECGADLVVEPRQAGGRVACECGMTLTVPPLRKLKDLPQAATEGPEKGDGWSFRSGVLTAGLLVALVLMGGVGYLRSIEPSPPAEYSAQVRDERLTENLGKMAPVQLYLLWQQDYQFIDRIGFEEMKDLRRDTLLRRIGQLRAIETGLAGAAGVVALLAFIAFAMLPKENRQSETA